MAFTAESPPQVADSKGRFMNFGKMKTYFILVGNRTEPFLVGESSTQLLLLLEYEALAKLLPDKQEHGTIASI